MHSYLFHMGDYATHTSHLSLMEDLAYRRILELYYVHESPPIGTPEQLARRIRMPKETAAVQQILNEFFCQESSEIDGVPTILWRNKRCDEEIKKYHDLKEHGRRGAEKRWHKDTYREAIATLSPPQCDPNANHKPETINQYISSSKEDVSSGDDPLSVDEVVEAWNDIAERRKLPKVAKITPERRRKLKARIQQNTIEEWRTALDAIDRSSFLCGDNDRGWKANFDFLLQPSSFTKLIEGVYDR